MCTLLIELISAIAENKKLETRSVATVRRAWSLLLSLLSSPAFCRDLSLDHMTMRRSQSSASCSPCSLSSRQCRAARSFGASRQACPTSTRRRRGVATSSSPTCWPCTCFASYSPGQAPRPLCLGRTAAPSHAPPPHPVVRAPICRPPHAPPVSLAARPEVRRAGGAAGAGGWGCVGGQPTAWCTSWGPSSPCRCARRLDTSPRRRVRTDFTPCRPLARVNRVLHGFRVEPSARRPKRERAARPVHSRAARAPP
jgi:hypothetical protein